MSSKLVARKTDLLATRKLGFLGTKIRGGIQVASKASIFSNLLFSMFFLKKIIKITRLKLPCFPCFACYSGAKIVARKTDLLATHCTVLEVP